MEDKKRVIWVDYAKAFSMMTVVLSHSAFPYYGKGLLGLPAFIFLAGWFHRPIESWGSFLRKRGQRILLPYVIFALGSYLLWVAVGRRYGAEEGLSWWEPLVGVLYGTSNRLIQNAPLWFLPAIFVTECLYNLVCGLTQRVGVRWGLIVVIFCLGVLNVRYNPYELPWGVHTALVVLPLFAAGVAVGSSAKAKGAIAGLRVWQLAVVCVLSAVLWVLVYRWNGEPKISMARIGNPLLFAAGCVGVVGMWLSVSMLLDRCLPLLRGLEYIGRNTMTILCLHIPLFSLIKAATYFVGGVPLSIYTTQWGCLLLWAGSLVLVLPFCWAINKYVPWLVGKKQS